MLSGYALTECDFVAVDLETTGCRPGCNSIIEVGAARFNAAGVAATFERLVRSTDSIPRAVEELTGIDSSMLAGAPSIADVMREFRDFCDGTVLVAHNYRFDLSFLDHEAETIWGAPMPRPTIDTLSLARRLRPDLRRYNLASLAQEYKTPTTPDHRAGNDARATAELLIALIPDLTRLGITDVGAVSAFCGLSNQSALADRLALTRGLPDEAGVYLFRDASGAVIFVGHARSLRTRARQYFYPGAASDQMAAEVASITAVRTPSHLDALLLEHRLVDRHKPRHNPAAHRSRAGYLIKVETGSAYPGVSVVEAPRKRGRLIGPFTSRWAALTLVETLKDVYDLRRCARRLDARLPMIPCSHRDAGTCPAPCVRVPDPAEYADRLDAALGVLEDDADFRSLLQSAQRSAARDGRYEDAIRYRDGVRALDRALSSLAIMREAVTRDVVLVEEVDGEAVVSFLRGGLRAAVLRGTRTAIDPKILPTIERVYWSGAPAVDPLRLSSEKIAELLIIASFAEGDSYLEVPVTDAVGTAAHLRRVLGLDRRTPRRRHGVVSGDGR
jgi:DNA polymerase-3 subunit epsilon